MKKLILCLGLLSSSVGWAGKFPSAAKPAERVVRITGRIAAPTILYKADELRALANKSKEPISIIINSPGGGVFAGLQFINAMVEAQSQGVVLNCYVPGMAASMALQLFVFCNNRYAYKYSLLLWHAPAVMGLMKVTATSAAELQESLTALEEILVPPLQRALQLNPEVFFYHYDQETLWTAESLVAVSPKFLTLVDEMDSVGAIWAPERPFEDSVIITTWERFDHDYSLRTSN